MYIIQVLCLGEFRSRYGTLESCRLYRKYTVSGKKVPLDFLP